MPKITPSFFTSDWHIFHKNVIDFDNRPFNNMDRMHQVLINNYNSSVGNDCICYFLGDFSMGNVEETKFIVDQLNGTKVLILGNHDRNASSMKRCGFDVVLYMASVVMGGKLVTMTHCPLRGVFREDTSSMKSHKDGEHWHGEFKHGNFSIPDWGQYHLHGHCHKGPEERILGRQWDVGVRANGYKPVSSGQIESWIALGNKG